MLKRFILTILASLFIFVGCSNKNKDAVDKKDKINISTSYVNSSDIKPKIVLLEKNNSNNKYITLGNLLFFPNPRNNEKLSVSDISKNINNINDDSVIDFFDYNVNSISTDGNYIYFSSISSNGGIYRLDYQKKDITKINDASPLEMIYQEDKLYYISSKDNKIYCYSIKDKETRLLSSSKSSTLVLNNNLIFYKNLSDNSKLYCLTIDGNNNFKIIDSQVDSFVINNNKILFSNLNDNSYLYSLDTSTYETKKILSTSVSNLQEYKSNIYFINNSNPNSLYLLKSSNENTEFESTEIFPYFVNEYYLTEKGIFIEAASSLDSIKIVKYN
ncbi:DUF5050 domain-containing protein [Clostridium sp. AL.422]|uniref:DUF5050 domain-containing protein n=1 Tax=Clostridium TaxID=1485 RepID=UPI00293DB1A0|nr:MULTISPECIES: DUF5050 domain-containing protein [unclassified Clostridium]MDV4150272.1 DUF5050 domain-containing protein [Clostridium sp. AL.422]